MSFQIFRGRHPHNKSFNTVEEAKAKATLLSVETPGVMHLILHGSEVVCRIKAGKEVPLPA